MNWDYVKIPCSSSNEHPSISDSNDDVLTSSFLLCVGGHSLSHKLGLSLHLIYFTFLLSVTRSSSFILYFSRLHFNTATTMDHYLPGMAVSTLHVPKSMTQTLTKTGTGRACGRSSHTPHPMWLWKAHRKALWLQQSCTVLTAPSPHFLPLWKQRRSSCCLLSHLAGLAAHTCAAILSFPPINPLCWQDSYSAFCLVNACIIPFKPNHSRQMGKQRVGEIKWRVY